MNSKELYTSRIALTVAMGGFLMGFDASVISGVVKFIEIDFALSKLQLGWSVSSLTLSATLAMMVAGPLSDKLGRRTLLKYAAVLYAISAIASAIAPDFITLVIARMLGGVGVGISLILAPMYIAEIAPPARRGRLVSFNQLNIVIGISVAFFTNYLILNWGQSDASWAAAIGLGEHNWRWMLGLEALPAVLYFLFLFFVPESPRWLIMKNKSEEARLIFYKITDEAEADTYVQNALAAIAADKVKEKVSFGELFKPAMKLVLAIGIGVAILQQITGINSVFFYAPMIFEQSGIGTDASFIQAILVGLVNLVFTVLAIFFVDRLGRKPLLIIGLAGITITMLLLSYGFSDATYILTDETIASLPEEVHEQDLTSLINITYESDVEFKDATIGKLGLKMAQQYESQLIAAAIKMNPMLILVGILGFVASFAISLGPVMWVLFSELFPMRIKGIAISFAGFVNSAISFIVQLVFPWELATLGSATTFLIYGLFAGFGLLFVGVIVPETKGKSLEELEIILVK
jgi:SP family arabinose:H+ symporter-like MFS transporter